MKKIDVDFGLNLYGDKTFEELRKSHITKEITGTKRKEKEKKKKQADKEYWAVFDEWKRLDDNKKNYAPKTPEEEFAPIIC